MKAIWINDKKENVYAEFKKDFTWNGEDTVLKISASRGYAAYINGKFVSNSQYADIPEYKAVDTVDITPFLHIGNNIFTAIVYHWDSDFATAKVMPAALVFSIEENGLVIAESDKNTAVRIANGYYKLDAKVTAQIGYGYGYDFTDTDSPWENAIEIHADFNYVSRPNKKLEIKEPKSSKVSVQGTFKYNGGNTSAERVMSAWLSTERFAEMTGENRLTHDDLHTPLTFKSDRGDGIFVIFDLGCECAGYLTFSLNLPRKCRAVFTWGEHLADLRVRSEIEGRSFASEFYLDEGENRFDEYLHRIGGRYLCIFVESSEIMVNCFTIREALYPFNQIERCFSDRLIQKIYDTSVRTLRLSVHEHYEDCPWREQALYGMDSRNQMLYGYSAFGEYELPRAILRLFAKSARPEGIIELCAPAVAPIVIPSFTLFAILAFTENAEVDYNTEFVKEFLPFAEKAISAFTSRAGEYGLEAFAEPEYWNFHEWCEGLDGGEIFRDKAIEPYFDGPLTALCIITLKALAEIEKKEGKEEKTSEYLEISKYLTESMQKYRDSKAGLYHSFVKNGKAYGHHSYTQSLYLLADIIPKDDIKTAIAELKNPKMCVPATLAALQLKYDAILKFDGDREFCLNEVSEIFGNMLFSGATSFWETERGEADFDDAGSLCHGWSAVPCWLFDKLNLEEK